MKRKNTVNVFYACDEIYVPYLSVSLLSLIEHTDKNRVYHITILENDISDSSKTKLRAMSAENITLSFTNVSDKLNGIADKLSLRDYYSLSIYFRLFIPALFPQLDKAVYLDSDTVLLADIGELYDTVLRDKVLVAAVPDAVIASEELFRRYAEEGVGTENYRSYFNSGVLVMNLAAMRKIDLAGIFLTLLTTYDFKTVCPDQDYLNVICRGRVRFLGKEWNRMTVDNTSSCRRLKLIHYNMYFKPWFYDNVPYHEFFDLYATRTPFTEQIKDAKAGFTEEKRNANEKAGNALRRSVQKIIDSPDNFRKILFKQENDLSLYYQIESMNTNQLSAPLPAR